MKRKIDDIDGMLEDIYNTYLGHSKSELVNIIMEINHNDQDENDLMIDWLNFCNGEIEE